MDLRTQLSFSSGMTKFLAGKQITLLNPSMTLNLGLHNLDDQKISKKLKKFHKEKTGKNEFDLEFKHEIEEEIDSV